MSLTRVTGLAFLAVTLVAQPGIVPVRKGKTIQRALAGGQSDSYLVRLKNGQFVRVGVRQLGIDVIVRLFAPDGQSVAEVDTIAGTQGQEVLFWVAQAAGDYRLEIGAQNPAAKAGRYESRVEELRTARADDRKRVTAQQAFREGQNRAAKNEYDRAIPAYERALKSYRDTRDPRGEATSLDYLGIAYNDLNENDKAVSREEQALVIWRQIKDREGEGTSLNSLGAAYTDLSEYEKAIGYLEQSLAIRRELKNRSGEAEALGNLATAYQYLSRFDKAIDYNRQALAIYRETKNRNGEAVILKSTGNDYLNLNQNDKAIDYFEQSLAINREVKNRRREAGDLTNIGIAYSYLGHDLPDTDPMRRSQYEKAIGYVEQALSIQREMKDRSREGISLEVLAASYRGLGNPEKAIGLLEQALAIFSEIKDRWRVGEALSSLGETYGKMNQPEKAIPYHVRALAIARGLKDRYGEAAALNGLMLKWQALAQLRLATFYGKEGVNALQSIRSDISGLSTDAQQSFLKSIEQQYRTLADILISQGRLPEAQQVLSLLKEQEYFGFVRGDGNAGGANGRADLTAEETEIEKRYREIADRLVAIGTEHGALEGKKTLTPAETQRLAQLEKDLETGNAGFQQFLGSLATQFAAKPAVAVKVEQLRDSQGLMDDLRDLPAGTVAIYTLVGEDKYRAILVTRDVQKAYEYPIGAADLNRKILAFREAVQNPSLDPRPLGQELYKILLGNMAGDLQQAGAQTLMWSLDGTLRYVPLAALYDGTRYLIERYGLSVFTPASNARLKDKPDTRWTGVGFGVTKAHEGAVALPGVRLELAGIIHEIGGPKGGVLEGDVRTDEAFTEQSMREELRKHFMAVHIASHFSFRPGDDTKSALLMGDGTNFTLAQMRKVPNLFGGVQVLTLSACNTGVGDNMGDGREVEGFGVLAQRQGAKAVIASLWPVADASTSGLMQEFYRIRESAAGVSKLEALREAQLGFLRGNLSAPQSSTADRSIHEALKKPTGGEWIAYAFDAKAPYGHPFYWAAFFLMGNWL